MIYKLRVESPVNFPKIERQNAEKIERPAKVRMVVGLEKKRRLPDGTVRMWNGTKYRKYNGEWHPFTEGHARGTGGSGPPEKAQEKVGSETEFFNVSPASFAVGLNKHTEPKHRDFVTHYTEAEYKEMGGIKTMRLSKDGKSGYVVLNNGYLMSVFSGARGRLPDMMKSAIADGATHLDCLGAGLAKKYYKAGFHITAQFPFDPAQAPKGWNVRDNGSPHYVEMSLKGRGKMEKSKDFDEDAELAELDKMIEAERNPGQKKTGLEDYADFLAGDGEYADK